MRLAHRQVPVRERDRDGRGDRGAPPRGAERAPPVGEQSAPDDFLSGTSGLVFGVRATSRALVRDAIADTSALARGWPWRLRRAAARWPRRRVLALGVERADQPNLLARARQEL